MNAYLICRNIYIRTTQINRVSTRYEKTCRAVCKCKRKLNIQQTYILIGDTEGKHFTIKQKKYARIVKM